MFQSVAPCPGKIAIQVEPFPVPKLQLLPESSKLATLPVAEPVAIATPLEADASQEDAAPTPVAVDTPFLMAEELEQPLAEIVSEAMEDEVPAPEIEEEEEPFTDEFFTSGLPVAEPVAVTTAPENLPEIVQETAIEPEIVEAPEFREEEATSNEYEAIASPFETASEESSPVGSVFEAAPSELPNPFQNLETHSFGEKPAEIPTASEGNQDFEQVTSGDSAAPAVTSWQPPAPSGKKKSSRFGGFFR